MHTIQKQFDKEAIRLAMLTKRMCAEAGLRHVTPLAFAVAIMRFEPNSVLQLLGRREIDATAVRAQLQEKFDALARSSGAGRGGYFTTRLDERCRSMLRAADQYRLNTRESHIRLLHLLLGVLKTESELLAMFERAGIPLRILESLLNERHQSKPENTPKAAPPPALAPAGPERGAAQSGDPFQEFCVNPRTVCGWKWLMHRKLPKIGRFQRFRVNA